MNIEHYVTVNFNSMIDVVDSVGGIDIDVQEDEMPYICGYVQEIMKVTGKLSPGVTEPGTQTLNGVQATARPEMISNVQKGSGRFCRKL